MRDQPVDDFEERLETEVVHETLLCNLLLLEVECKNLLDVDDDQLRHQVFSSLDDDNDVSDVVVVD